MHLFGALLDQVHIDFCCCIDDGALKNVLRCFIEWEDNAGKLQSFSLAHQFGIGGVTFNSKQSYSSDSQEEGEGRPVTRHTHSNQHKCSTQHEARPNVDDRIPPWTNKFANRTSHRPHSNGDDAKHEFRRNAQSNKRAHAHTVCVAVTGGASGRTGPTTVCEPHCHSFTVQCIAVEYSTVSNTSEGNLGTKQQ